MRLRLYVWAALVAALSMLLGPGAASAVVHIGDEADSAEFDSRTGKVAPTTAQRRAAASLGARVSWNRFGTPATIVKRGKFLATGIRGATAPEAAKRWIGTNRSLLGLGSRGRLAFESDALLKGSKGHAVNFRQSFGGLEAAEGGLLTIGLTGSKAARWKVAFVSSSLTRDVALAKGDIALNASQAWVRAADSVGLDASLRDVRSTKQGRGWTNLSVSTSSDVQRAKLVAFPTPRSGVVPAYETLVLKQDEASADRVIVDARDGEVLASFDLVHNLAQAELAPQTFPFNGTVPATDAACGPMHGPYAVGPGVRALDGFAAATVPTNDVVLNLFREGVLVLSADTLFSPEQFHYEPPGGVPTGNYTVQVCDFADGAVWLEPRTYTGTFTIDDTPPPPPYLARWTLFPANPPLGALDAYPWNRPGTDTRETWCWVGAPGCDEVIGNLASRAPWDHDLKADTPTFTTRGNNASAAESWTHPLLPSPTQFRPTSLARDYTFPWTDEWNQTDCSTANFVPGVGYDISAAATNLFVAHNRMHDWAYNLGFTERNWNAQDVNFGLTEAFRQNDPLIGNVQAGAAIPTPVAFVVGSRNNANMIPLPEGVSAITNMYLWQPQQAGFYPPCADGDYDMAVIGHEYGHLIENRMIGKGSTRAGHHAGAMGESVSDLMAAELLNAYGLVPTGGENPFAVGAYATGEKQRGIRNYGMNFPSAGGVPEPGKYPKINALNFSDMGYDVTGPQVHADGEIWSATNYSIRQALIAKYDRNYPADDDELQRECADGQMAAHRCPGNRRWIQLMFDSFLLMPTGPSMLQARDAILAADLMRFGGANQDELWLEFARRGFGRNATSSNTAANTDTDPTPDFEAIGTASATIRFVARNSSGALVPARVFVGHYEGRVSPIADTNAATTGANLDDTARFAPGKYELIANAPGYGHVRFGERFRSNQSKTIVIRFATNFASRSQGATASGNATGADPAAQAIQLGNLIDDTEATNWAAPGTVTGGNLSVDGTQVTVDLAGSSAQRVKHVQVSAMLGPGQSRYSALRKFELWTCNDDTGADCAGGSGFTLLHSSIDNAFPGDAPRPVAPVLILREFDVKDANATHVRLVVKTNQCTGGPDFQGDQDTDPLNNADCDSNVAAGAGQAFVRAAELQVFGARSRAD